MKIYILVIFLNILLTPFPSLSYLSYASTSSAEKLQNHYANELEVLGHEIFDSVISLIRGFLNLSRTNDSPTIINGRLTLTSGTAITTSDVTAATTVYFTPYNGNKIALYSGTIWQLLSFSETSVAVPSTTTTPFDIFAYNNSGTLALETVNWTNDTTRATALTTQNGVLVKTGATTRRYLGTARTTSSSGQTEDSLQNRLLWNYYNQVPRGFSIAGTGNGYSYATASWRSANNDTTNRVTVIIGVAGIMIRLSEFTIISNGGVPVQCGIGVDSTTTNSAQNTGYSTPDSTSNLTKITANYVGTPSAGFHYYQMLEYGNTGTGWYNTGSNGGIMGFISGG